MPNKQPLDLPAIQRRWTAWWQQEMDDRPVIMLHAPRQGMVPDPSLAVDPVTFWCDAAYRIHLAEHQLQNTLLLGEALPSCWNPISAGHSLYYGTRPHFLPDTVYVESALCPGEAYPDLSAWRESAWYYLARAQHTAFALASQGRWAVPPFFGNHEGDTLALILGSERFYLELLENEGEPSPWLAAALEQICTDLIEVHRELDRSVAPEVTGFPGSYNHIGPWSPTSTLFYDCDVSCNISPRLFQRYFLPLQVQAMLAVDHRLYHLDGARALMHLDALLGTPEIQAIQWVPGAGQNEIAQWFPLLAQIQRSSKSLLIYLQPGELETVLAALHNQILRPEGLAMDIWCKDENQANDCLRKVEMAFTI